MTPQERRLRQALAVNLRRTRNDKKLTLETAAERAGIHMTTWQRIETENVSAKLETVARLAIVLDIDPLLLFSAP